MWRFGINAAVVVKIPFWDRTIDDRMFNMMTMIMVMTLVFVVVLVEMMVLLWVVVV
jgi:hypothetical protein